MRRDWFELLTKSIGKCGEVSDEVKDYGVELSTTLLELPPCTSSTS
jgi:hypothetical protein